MKFDLIVCDCPWSFSDKLTMDNVARGAATNYDLLSNEDLKKLDVPAIAADNAVLALWVPSSLLPIGLEVMSRWGFRHVQTWIWVKTKKNPAQQLKQQLRKKSIKNQLTLKDADQVIDSFDFNEILGFGMGRLFRQCHELVLVGVKGKPYNQLKNKSQRSVSLDPATPHSVKPDSLQHKLELMFPKAKHKLEMFARRDLTGWTCVGNECPSTLKEDITTSIARLAQL